MRGLWHSGGGAVLEEKKSKSIIHPFVIKGYNGLTLNPYQGCSHRCAYCYATYEWSPEFTTRFTPRAMHQRCSKRSLRRGIQIMSHLSWYLLRRTHTSQQNCAFN